MTEPMVDDALVEVTPEDREAAASVLPPLFRAEVIAGKHDTAGNCSAVVQGFARHRLAGVAAGREEVSAAIREVRLAEAAYAEGKSGAVNRLDAALKALFACEAAAIRNRGEG